MNHNNGKKPATIIYGIAVVFVLILVLMPKIDYKDSWNQAYAKVDSSTKVSDPQLKKKLLDEGGAELLKCLEEHPYHARLHLMAGYYYFLKEEYDSTIALQINALDIGSGGIVNSIEHHSRSLLTDATIRKGMYLIAKGDTNSTIELYINSIKYNSDNIILNKNLGAFLLNKKRVDEAISYYQKAHWLNKKDAIVTLDLSKCYYLKKNADSAVYYANLTLALEPQNLNAQSIINAVQK